MINHRRDGKRIDWKTLLFSVLISEGVGMLSSILTLNDLAKYQCLVNPAFAPPAEIFQPIWLVLYLLMGIAAYLIYQSGPCLQEVKDALFYYGSQLIFNFMWPILFFRFDLRGVALLDLLVLIVFVIITISKFCKINKSAAQLMLPYLVWLVYAAVLNYSIWVLNK